ncbi:MAG: histidinol phosphate phosphatase domain-containing protein [Candidatus Omnitrophica bacterium]|nr:histidinol phosphate phosphatase domain-containing protein [Candidatus Omnitrophota bacterium]
MIGLHSHTLFSDGALLPSEMIRRAEAKGYSAFALTDHVDLSNIDFVLPRIVKVCRVLNKFWKIRAIPGVEITHVPVQEIKPLVKFARRNGAKIVVVHGETVAEPVLKGTNRAGIEAGCDILAHPGMILMEDVKLAAKKGVYLEITTRKSHSATNRRLFRMAALAGAKLVLNTDAHDECDVVDYAQAVRLLKSIGMGGGDIEKVFRNSVKLVKKVKG